MMLVSILQDVTEPRRLSLAPERVGLLSIAGPDSSCGALTGSASMFMGRVAVAAKGQIRQIVSFAADRVRERLTDTTNTINEGNRKFLIDKHSPKRYNSP